MLKIIIMLTRCKYHQVTESLYKSGFVQTVQLRLYRERARLQWVTLQLWYRHSALCSAQLREDTLRESLITVGHHSYFGVKCSHCTPFIVYRNRPMQWIHHAGFTIALFAASSRCSAKCTLSKSCTIKVHSISACHSKMDKFPEKKNSEGGEGSSPIQKYSLQIYIN